MSLQLLRVLADGPLPATLTRPSEINDLLVLRAAGLVAAVTLRASQEPGAGEVARCFALTPQGRTALRDGCHEPGMPSFVPGEACCHCQGPPRP